MCVRPASPCTRAHIGRKTCWVDPRSEVCLAKLRSYNFLAIYIHARSFFTLMAEK